MVLPIGIKLQLSALNSLTIVTPNYPMFAKVWKFSLSLPQQNHFAQATYLSPCLTSASRWQACWVMAGWPWKLRNWLNLNRGETIKGRQPGVQRHQKGCPIPALAQIKPSFPVPWTLDTFKPGYHPSSPVCCEDLHNRSKDLWVDLHRDPLCSEHTEKQRGKGMFGYGKLIGKFYMPGCSFKKKIINSSKDVYSIIITELEKIELTVEN